MLTLVRQLPHRAKRRSQHNCLARLSLFIEPKRNSTEIIQKLITGLCSLHTKENCSRNCYQAVSTKRLTGKSQTSCQHAKMPLNDPALCADEIHYTSGAQSFLARGPHLSFRNPSRATRTNNLNKNSLKIPLND